jgi:segregation and condensation protein B
MEELEIQTDPVTPVEQPGESETAAVAETAEAEGAGVPVCEPDPCEEGAGEGARPAEAAEMAAVSVEELLPVEPNVAELPLTRAAIDEAQLKAALEAIVYVTEEPVTVAQIANALGQPQERIRLALGELAAEFERPGHGLIIKEVAGGYKMATKAEHHDTVRAFVKSLKAPLKLSLPALETLAVVAYKQPVTAPEIMEIRGVQGAGVLKTLLDRKLIAAAGRKNVIGKPILYKTTKEFLVQFGLKDVAELPSLKEFEEIRRLALTDEEEAPAAETTETPATEAADSDQPNPAAEPEAATATDAIAAPAGETVADSDEPAPAAEPEAATDSEAMAAPADETVADSDQLGPAAGREAASDLPEPEQGA